MEMLQIRLMLNGMLQAQYDMNRNDMFESIMSAINLLIEHEIKRKQPTIRKFQNLPDKDIVLTPYFWEVLKAGDLVAALRYLREVNNHDNLGLAEARVLAEALRSTV